MCSLLSLPKTEVWRLAFFVDRNVWLHWLFATLQLHVRPTLHLEEFQDKAIALGVGSPAHRKYFETLYTHYGGGVSDGVTFEEMVDYEVEIMDPLMYAYFLPAETFVYQRVPSDTSGMWERWTTTIAKHYDLAGNELVQRRPHYKLYATFVEKDQRFASRAKQ